MVSRTSLIVRLYVHCLSCYTFLVFLMPATHSPISYGLVWSNCVASTYRNAWRTVTRVESITTTRQYGNTISREYFSHEGKVRSGGRLCSVFSVPCSNPCVTRACDFGRHENAFQNHKLYWIIISCLFCTKNGWKCSRLSLKVCIFCEKNMQPVHRSFRADISANIHISKFWEIKQ